MIDYTVTDPHCVSDPDFFSDDCGSPAWAYGLFISWNILSMYIFANMVCNPGNIFIDFLASHRRLRQFLVRLPTRW